MKRNLLWKHLLASIWLLFFSALSFAQTSVIVKQSDVGTSWYTNDTGPGGVASFTNGPATPPRGCGSLQLAMTGAAKAQLYNYSFNGTKLSDITQMSYWAYRFSTSTNSLDQTIGLNVEVDFVGDGSSYTTLVFEPVYQTGGVGAMLLNTWQKWDAYNGGNAKWWSHHALPGVCPDNCFVTWNAILAANPNAKIKGGVGPNIGSGWTGQYTGNFDDFTFGTASNTKIFNFEQVDNPVVNTNTGRTYCSIQAAINDPLTLDGHTIQVGAGTFAGADVTKRLTIQGAGNGSDPSSNSIITSQLRLSASGTDATNQVLIQNFYINAGPSGKGVYAVGSFTKLNNLVVEGNSYGIELAAALTDFTINLCNVKNNGSGIRMGSEIDVNRLTITNCNVDNNQFGLESYKSSSSTSNLNNLTVTNTTFINDAHKGLYFEKLNNALFDHIVVSSCGNQPTDQDGGFDINLKFGNYQNIQIINSTIADNGKNNPNGAGLFIKARSSGSYASSPATLNNVTVINSFLSNNGSNNSSPVVNNPTPTGAYSGGIRIGDAKNSFIGGEVGPTGVQIHNNSITGNQVRAIINATSSQTLVDATCNWYGSADAPTVTSMIEGPVTYVPFLTSDGDGAGTGFQPTGSCNGPQPTIAFTATTSGSHGSTAGGIPATVTIDFCQGGFFTFSGYSSTPGSHVGALEKLNSSGNVTYAGGPIPADRPQAYINPSDMAAFFSGTYGPYGLSSGTSGTIDQTYTPYYDVNNNNVYDAGIDILGTPVVLHYNIYALPTITCSATQTVNTDPGVCTAGVTYTVSSTGSPAPTITYTFTGATTGTGSGDGSGSTFNKGTTTVTVTATNSCGTASCSFDITVVDNEKPTIACAGPVSMNNDAGVCSATVTLTAPTTGDNCGVASVTNDAPVNSQYPVGSTTVTWTVTDTHGYTATCTQTVTVTDNEDPTITCSAPVSVNNDAGKCYATVELTAPTTHDNCGVASVTNDAPVNSQYPVGSTTVTWTVTDTHGHTATCTQTVTVTDNTAPSITCAAPVSVNNDLGLCSATVTLTAPATSDNCGVASVTNNHESTTYPVGTTTVTWTVTDIHGNTNTCTQTVTVTDNEKPTITCPPNQIVNPTSLAGAVVTYTAPVGADNCPGATTSRIAGLPSGSTFPIGTTTVAYTVTDASGNSATCSFTITVGGLPYCDKKKGDDVIMCHNGKQECVKLKDVQKNIGHGWSLGPCTQASCGTDETLMCHNGQTECVKNKDVQKKKKEGWHEGSCSNGGGDGENEGHGENGGHGENDRTGNTSNIAINPQSGISLPVVYKLSNYPNPFVGTSTIKYDLPFDSRVSIKVYDLMGRVVTTLVDADKKAGSYTVDFKAGNLSSGSLYYRIIANSKDKQFEQTNKMTQLK